MRRAQRRGAVLTEKFWWRRDIGAPKDMAPDASNAPDQYAEMTIDEIINGKVWVFVYLFRFPRDVKFNVKSILKEVSIERN